MPDVPVARAQIYLSGPQPARVLRSRWRADHRRCGGQRRLRADCRSFRSRPGMGRFDPQKTFTAPTYRHISEKVVIGPRPLGIPTAGSRQLVEQPLRFFEVGGVEALSEPVANWGKQIAGFGS